MNFDRISFRTSPEQRAFLERINQRYHCRTITGLMRKLLDEVMKKESVLLVGKSIIPESLDPDNPLAIIKQSDNGRMLLKDTRMEAIPSIQNLQNLQSTSKPLSYSDNPYLDALQEIFWLEEARQKLDLLRSLPKSKV